VLAGKFVKDADPEIIKTSIGEACFPQRDLYAQLSFLLAMRFAANLYRAEIMVYPDDKIQR